MPILEVLTTYEVRKLSLSCESPVGRPHLWPLGLSTYMERGPEQHRCARVLETTDKSTKARTHLHTMHAFDNYETTGTKEVALGICGMVGRLLKAPQPHVYFIASCKFHSPGPLINWAPTIGSPMDGLGSPRSTDEHPRSFFQRTPSFSVHRSVTHLHSF